MCELIIIAAVFAVAIEIKCGELFNYGRIGNQRVVEKLRQNDAGLSGVSCRADLGSDKNIPVFCCRECACEKAEKVDSSDD